MAGFKEKDGKMVLLNSRFEVKAYQVDGTWFYDWRSIEENCGADGWQLQNITQITFYL